MLACVVGLPLATSALLALSCVEPSERADHHLRRGHETLAEGEVQAALLEFQSALTYRPGDAALYEKIGDTLWDHQQAYRESLKYYQEARRLDPKRIHSSMRAARLIAFDNLPRARSIVETARRNHPRNPAVHRAVSHVRILENELDQALFAARRAVELDETSPPSWAQLGAVHLAKIRARRERGERPSKLLFSLALGSFDKVNETKGGNHPRAILEKGRVYWFAGQRENARKEFSKAIRLVREQGPPSEVRFVYATIVDYALRADEPALLRFMLRLSVTDFPEDFGAWEALGNAYDAFPGHSGEEIFLELIGTFPDDAQAHLLYAGWLSRQSRVDDARSHIQRARQDGVDDPRLLEGLVRLELRSGDLPAARATWVEMTDEAPGELATDVAGARIALAEGRPEDAIRTLESREETNYRHELLRLLALAQLERGDPRAARRAVGQALALAPPSNVPLQRLLARIALENERWGEATSAYQAVLELGGKLSARERAGYAAALYHDGRPDQGRPLLDELLTLRPPPARAALVFAEFAGEGKKARAYDLLRRAHRWAPGEPEVLETLTQLDLEAGRSGIALQRINQLVNDRRADARALQLRAEILTHQRAFEAAEADVLRALETDPTLPGAIDQLYSLYRVQGKITEARRAFERADEAGVLHVGGRHLLALLYLEDRETERARDTLQQVVAESPGRTRAQADLAYVLALRGEELERAHKLASGAVSQDPDDPRALNALGWVELQSGRNAVALTHFDGGIQSAGRGADPLLPTLQYHRGLALRALGRETDAVEAFEEALRQGNFPEAEDARQQLEAARHLETQPSPS